MNVGRSTAVWILLLAIPCVFAEFYTQGASAPLRSGYDAKAYLGLTVPGFPNFFMLTGPNTGLAHGGNQIFMTECAVRHLMLCLRELVESGQRSIECRADVYENYNREVDAMHAGMVWTHKGMTNWYRNPHGRVFAITPWRLVEYWKMTSTFDAAEYEMR